MGSSFQAPWGSACCCRAGNRDLLSSPWCVMKPRLPAWEQADQPQALSGTAFHIWQNRFAKHKQTVQSARAQTDLVKYEREILSLTKATSGHEHARRFKRQEEEAAVRRANQVLVQRLCEVARQSERRQCRLASGEVRGEPVNSSLNGVNRRKSMTAINKENAALLRRLENAQSSIHSVSEARDREHHEAVTARLSRHRRPASDTAKPPLPSRPPRWPQRPLYELPKARSMPSTLIRLPPICEALRTPRSCDRAQAQIVVEKKRMPRRSREHSPEDDALLTPDDLRPSVASHRTPLSARAAIATMAQERAAAVTGPLSASHSSQRSLTEPPRAEATAQRGQLLTTIKGWPPPACQRSFVNSTASTTSEQGTGTSTVTSADEERLWLLSPCEPATEWASPSGTRLGEDEEIGIGDKTAQQERENDVEIVESSTRSVASAGRKPSSASLELGVHELVSLSGDIEKRRQATGCCNLVCCDDAEMKDADTPKPNVDCDVSCSTSSHGALGRSEGDLSAITPNVSAVEGRCSGTSVAAMSVECGSCDGSDGNVITASLAVSDADGVAAVSDDDGNAFDEDSFEDDAASAAGVSVSPSFAHEHDPEESDGFGSDFEAGEDDEEDKFEEEEDETDIEKD
uniref:Uncharacterized protein n=1 Tax=Noctiluca scintillans TaxID=2966 RepID=A0A7S1ASM7_NOCSC